MDCGWVCIGEVCNGSESEVWATAHAQEARCVLRLSGSEAANTIDEIFDLTIDQRFSHVHILRTSKVETLEPGVGSRSAARGFSSVRHWWSLGR